MRQDVYEELKRRIVQLEFRPGEALQELDLAQEFGVSRTPVREAFVRLEAEGLVRTIRGRGAYVTEVSLQQVRDAFEIQDHLAPLLARLLVERATLDEIARMRELVDAMRAQSDAIALRGIDLAFHQVLDRATHNVLLASTLERLRNQISRVWDSNVPAGEDHYFVAVAGEFAALVAAIERKDAQECTRILRAHAARFIEEILSFWRPQASGDGSGQA